MHLRQGAVLPDALPQPLGRCRSPILPMQALGNQNLSVRILSASTICFRPERCSGASNQSPHHSGSRGGREGPGKLYRILGEMARYGDPRGQSYPLCGEWLRPALQQLPFMDSELATPGMCHVDGHFQFSKPTLSHHQGTLLKGSGPIFYLPSLFPILSSFDLTLQSK